MKRLVWAVGAAAWLTPGPSLPAAETLIARAASSTGGRAKSDFLSVQFEARFTRAIILSPCGNWRGHGSAHLGGAWEIYNMTADRTEVHDLATRQPEKVKELAAQWEAWGKGAKAKAAQDH